MWERPPGRDRLVRRIATGRSLPRGARLRSSSVTPTIAEVQARVSALANRFATEREARSVRTALEPADFGALAGTGFLLTGVPESMGGLWCGLDRAIRPYATMVRGLARADPSLALVAAMHPAVLAFWLAVDAVDDLPADWSTQRARFFETAKAGHWWGTFISEPGSGGDPTRTRTRAEPDGPTWCLTGEKHFGSGAGATSFMITTARSETDDRTDIYVVDMRGRAWDGTAGLTLRRAWDGHGMMATQSHAFGLERCPAERMASHEGLRPGSRVTGQLGALLFSAVILGVLDVAIGAGRDAVAPRWRKLRAYEQVAWTQAANQAWLAEQAFEGGLRAVESGDAGVLGAARAKLTIAELAENALGLLARVVGGASYSRSQPFGQWMQDVRSLGYLRPPWGFAYDQLLGSEFISD
jgi:alkylation response protein AidB-like acyl-CoA dehydrogenase